MRPCTQIKGISSLLILPVFLFVFPNLVIASENSQKHVWAGDSFFTKSIVPQHNLYPLVTFKQLMFNPKMRRQMAIKREDLSPQHLRFAKVFSSEVIVPVQNSKPLTNTSGIKKLEFRKNGFFDAGKYYFGDQSVSGKKEFQDIMKRQPAAYRVYRKARPWSALGTISMVGIAILAIIELGQTADKSNKVRNGEIVDDRFESSTIVSLGGLAITSIFASSQARKYQKKGIKKFNALEMRNR